MVAVSGVLLLTISPAMAATTATGTSELRMFDSAAGEHMASDASGWEKLHPTSGGGHAVTQPDDGQLALAGDGGLDLEFNRTGVAIGNTAGDGIQYSSRVVLTIA